MSIEAMVLRYAPGQMDKQKHKSITLAFLPGSEDYKTPLDNSGGTEGRYSLTRYCLTYRAPLPTFR